MADLSAKISAARKAGYNDDEITAFLAKDAALGSKVEQARTAGYRSGQILGYLTRAPGKEKALEKYRKQYRDIREVPILGGHNEGLIARARGAAFGWLDEAQGGVAAGATALQNALSPITGKPAGFTAKEAYAAARQASLEQEADYAKRHPINNAAQQVAGGSWVGGGKYIGGAKSLGQAALRSAQVGAGIGAVAGAGTASDGHRVKGALVGGAIGGAIGGATPYVARGAQEVAKRVGGAASEVSDRIKIGAGKDLEEITPDQADKAAGSALEYVQGIARRGPKNALTKNPIEASGKPITAAEALGRSGVTELGAVARRSGKTGDALESTLRQRQQAMPSRVLSDLEGITGLSPEAVQGDFAAQAAQLRTKAAPLYEKAYAQPPVQNEKLDRLMRRPSMREAMKRAASIAAEEGRDPTALGFDFDAGGDVVHVRTPSNQTLDYVKRGIDDVLEGYRDGTTGKLRLDERGRAVLGTLNEFKGIVAPEGSSYRAALDAGGDPIRLEQAFSGSKRLMSNGVSLRTFAQRFDAMAPADKEAHVAGFVNDAFQGAQSGRLRLRDMQTPLYAQKLSKMLGPGKAEALLVRLEQEAQLARTGGRMMPGAGSPTMELQAAARDQEEATNALLGAGKKLAEGKPVSAALHAIGSPIVGAYRGARVPLDRATRDEVGRLLQLSPSELDALLADLAKNPPKARIANTAPASNALARSVGVGAAEKRERN